jgi:hypothetical protein
MLSASVLLFAACNMSVDCDAGKVGAACTTQYGVFQVIANGSRVILSDLTLQLSSFSFLGSSDMPDSEESSPTAEDMRDAVVSMAVESWRFAKVFDRLLTKLDAGEQNRYNSQFRWFIKKVEEALEAAQLRIVNIEGHPFDPGVAATPLNIEEFDTNIKLMVDQMLEPIIMGREGLIRTGIVTLRKVEP